MAGRAHSRPHCCQEALRHNPQDGIVWSSLGSESGGTWLAGLTPGPRPREVTSARPQECRTPVASGHRGRWHGVRVRPHRRPTHRDRLLVASHIAVPFPVCPQHAPGSWQLRRNFRSGGRWLWPGTSCRALQHLLLPLGPEHFGLRHTSGGRCWCLRPFDEGGFQYIRDGRAAVRRGQDIASSGNRTTFGCQWYEAGRIRSERRLTIAASSTASFLTRASPETPSRGRWCTSRGTAAHREPFPLRPLIAAPS